MKPVIPPVIKGRLYTLKSSSRMYFFSCAFSAKAMQFSVIAPVNAGTDPRHSAVTPSSKNVRLKQCNGLGYTDGGYSCIRTFTVSAHTARHLAQMPQLGEA